MKKICILFIVLVIISFSSIELVYAQTYVGGYVSGEWTTAGSPYLVVDTLFIQADDTLIIDPGVTVDFQGHYQFYIFGLLQAIGTESDSIFFTTNTVANPDRWSGLRFDNADDSCKIQFCRIEYGNAVGSCPHNRGGAIYCAHCNPIISNNTISNNSAASGAGTWGGGGIYCDYASPTIIYNTINNNTTGHDGGGIYCYSSSPLIANNCIKDNVADFRGGGIACFVYSNPIIKENIIQNNSPSGIHSSGSSPKIKNNKIMGNQGNGIYCYMYGVGQPHIIGNLISKNAASCGGAIYNEGSSPIIVNNTIVDNTALSDGGGIYNLPVYFPLLFPSNPVITNNILYSNSSQEGTQIYSSTSCTTNVSYSDIQDKDLAGVYGEILWGDGVIDLEPVFADTFYHLDGVSPCIDAGSPDTSGLYLLSYDLDYNLRVWDGDGSGGETIDIGAYEYDAPPYGINELYDGSIPLISVLLFPNPSINETYIRYNIPFGDEIAVELYDVSGRKVMYREFGFLKSGTHELSIDCSDLSGGIYFIRLQGYETLGIVKFILLP